MFLPVILCDLDAAFLGFELLRRPELAHRPVIVGGTVERRGVVATASYEARAFGVTSGMSTAEALSRCKGAILVPVDIPYYRAMSERFRSVVTRGIAVWEPVALDEVYLNLEGQRSAFPDALALARSLQRAVREELGLACSVGCAPGRHLAKMACEFRGKPGGIGVLTAQEATAFLAPLPVGALPGVGPGSVKILERYGVRTCRDLAELSETTARRCLGQRGTLLRQLASGIDPSRPQPPGPARSMSVEETFPTDLSAPAEVHSALVRLSWELGSRLGSLGCSPREVAVRWRTVDFRDRSRQRTLPYPLQTRIDLRKAVLSLWSEAAVRGPVRLLGISAGRLESSTAPLLPDAHLEQTIRALEANGADLRPASLL